MFQRFSRNVHFLRKIWLRRANSLFILANAIHFQVKDEIEQGEQSGVVNVLLNPCKIKHEDKI